MKLYDIICGLEKSLSDYTCDLEVHKITIKDDNVHVTFKGKLLQFLESKEENVITDDNQQ